MMPLHPSASRSGRWSCVLLTLCLFLGGCSRFDTVSDPVARSSELVGYEVRVKTTDGRVLRFVLREVTESHLVGDLQRVRLDNVAEIERWHFDTLRTGLLFGALAGVYSVLAFHAHSGSWLPW